MRTMQLNGGDEDRFFWKEALLFAVMALVGFGLILAISVDGHDPDLGVSGLLRVRLPILAVAGLAFVVGRYVPLQRLRALVLPAFAISLLLCLLPHFFTGRNGAQRWVHVFGFSFQPVELLKVMTVLATADLVDRFRRYSGDFKRGLLPVLIPGLLAFVFLALQPDFGHALFLLVVAGILVVQMGIRPKHGFLLSVGAFGLLGLGFLLFSHARRRLAAFLGEPNLQLERGIRAIDEGGLLGLGPGEGFYQVGYLAEAQNDFILAIIGNEFGLMGSLLVIGLFALLFWAAMRIAATAATDWEFLIVLGLALNLVLQACFNILGVLQLIPEKGINLPFLSAGGSNLVFALASVGILANIADRAVRSSEIEGRETCQS
jgi:cell division protein FtsW